MFIRSYHNRNLLIWPHLQLTQYTLNYTSIRYDGRLIYSGSAYNDSFNGGTTMRE